MSLFNEDVLNIAALAQLIRETGSEVIVDGAKYFEFINYQYEIANSRLSEISPNSDDDKIEREYILQRCDKCINVLTQDANSRRAAFSITYDNNLCKCISLIHFWMRENVVAMNAYYRSQNAEKNLRYDVDTLTLAIDKVCMKLNAKRGYINVFCANLHVTG